MATFFVVEIIMNPLDETFVIVLKNRTGSG